MYRLLIGLVVLVAVLQLQAPLPAGASNVKIFRTLVCSSTHAGRANVALSWQGSSSTAQQQWVDLSFSNNGWQPGTFVGAGPFSAQTSNSNRDGLLANTVYYVRINQRFSNGLWDPSATYTFTTPDCGGPPSTATSAIAGLATLTLRPAAPQTGYMRSLFGPAWQDVDQNGCDTRNDILRRDMIDIVFKPGSTCDVDTGTLLDPYTGKAIDFVQGPGTSFAVQIEHVVALAAAWRTGAADWGAAKRLQFANDPDHLLAADGPTNQAKGDDDAADWLPPNLGFRCTYVSIQIAIKVKYSLWVTPQEHNVLADVLEDCVENAASGPHTWYTSAAASARVYYCDLDEGWKNLSPSNLRSFSSLQELLAIFSNRTKTANSRC